VGDPDADAIAAAALACQGVVSLHGGPLGDVAAYLPGRTVSGVRLAEDRVEVHVVARYGTVSGFGAGVLIKSETDNVNPPSVVAVSVATGGNTVSGITVKDNVGSCSGNFGDGILVDTSTFNTVSGNTVNHNGPFDGIGVIGQSVGNTITGNTVTNNNVDCSPTLNQDDGIRLEPDTARNRVAGNTVTNSGLDGIAVFNPTGATSVTGNTVANNGNHGKTHRPGDGIRVFSPAQASVESNTVCANAGNGIIVGGGVGTGANLVTANNVGAGTTGCSANAAIGYPATFDLHDQAMNGLPPTPAGVPCLSDVWRANFTAGDSFNHNCTTNP